MQLWKRADGRVKCMACARGCLIAEGQAGFCGVRKNIGGKLVCIVYGKPVAVHLDPIEKKPLFHFLPGTGSFSIGTAGCNLACVFCQNWDISQARRVELSGEELAAEAAVEAALRSGAKSISLTYNEPTVFIEYAMDVCRAAKAAGLKTVFVTNGYESKEAWGALKGLLDAANIDLKGPDSFYQKLCSARLQPVLDSIRTAHDMGVWIEITTLTIPGENDSDADLKAIAEFVASIDAEMPWHVTAFRPEYKLLDKEPTPLETLMRAREIGFKAGLKHVYIGNVAGGFENTICPSCKKTVIERAGFSIKTNRLRGGRCPCGQTIKGVWK